MRKGTTATMSTTAPTTQDPRQRVPEHTVVRMVNEGPEPFNGIYLGQTYHVPAGDQAFVPFYAMCLWAGHPDAVDIDKKRRYRTEELQRLQVKYGTHSFNGCWTTELCRGNPDPKNGQKHPPTRHLPNITFFSVDTNTPYNTVLADPEGAHATQTAVAATQDDLSNRAMRDMQKQIEQLQRDLAAMHNNAGNPTPPPAPAPSIPPQPGTSTPPPNLPTNEDGEVTGDDGDDLPPSNGPLDHAVPASEEEIAALEGNDTPTRKPRIPPAPGPLRG